MKRNLNRWILLLAALLLSCAVLPAAMAENATLDIAGDIELAMDGDPVSIDIDSTTDEGVSVDIDPSVLLTLDGETEEALLPGSTGAAVDDIAILDETTEAQDSPAPTSDGDFVIEDGVLKAYTGAGGAVAIPNTVIIISEDAFWDCDTMTSVSIPNSVTSIGESAFRSCDGLSDLSIPGSVKTVGESAFRDCSRLYSVTLEAGVEMLDEEAFRDCGSLQRFTMNDGLRSIKANVFVGCRIEELIFPDSVTELAGNATYGSWYNDPLSESLKKVRWPAGVKDIHDDQFHDFSALKQIDLPGDLESIGKYAFCGCEKLTGLVIPATVSSIGESAFYNCDGLTAVTIPNGVPVIGDETFYDCDRITEIAVPGSVKSIGEKAFKDCDNLNTVTLAAGVEVIYAEAFRDCGSLKRFTMSEGLRTVKNGVFIGCRIEELLFPDTVTELAGDATYGSWYNGPLSESLKKVRWPAGVKDIHDDQFHDFSALKQIDLPGNLESIGKYAFCGCENLTDLVIPATVSSIGESAFYNCDGLTAVTIPNGVPVIGDETFYDCDRITEIAVPGSVKSIGEKAFKDCDKLNTVTLAAGVEVIYAEAFRDCGSLKRFTMSEGLRTVKNGVFIGCRIEELLFPDTVTELAGDATYGSWYNDPLSESLKKVHWPAGVQEVHQNQFKDFSVLKEAVIGKGVRTIADSAFDNCAALKSVFVPSSVSTIAANSFESCPKLEVKTPRGSYAESYAKENDIPIETTDESGNVIPVKTVKLNKTKATVVVGDKLTLKATINPSRILTPLTWKSSNTKVAKVSPKGVVTALKQGTATITVKTRNGKKATCKITVPTPPKSVSFAKKSYDLKVGKTLKLTAKLNPAKAKTTLTWKTSAKKIASVTSKGVVKGLKKGKAVITVKTANGKTAKVTIVVK